MHSLLQDGRLNDAEINSVVADLFAAGIDSVISVMFLLNEAFFEYLLRLLFWQFSFLETYDDSRKY